MHRARCTEISHLMLLSVHVTSVLFLLRFNNFALTTGFYWSYTLLLKLPFLCALGCVRLVLAMSKAQYRENRIATCL